MRFVHCPYCGEKLIEKEIGDEGKIPFCESCNIPLWDTFTTCVICAVVNECGEIALLKQEYISSAKYVCVSGIMKIGESAEEAAAREIREELGLDVKKLHYIKTYPYSKKEMLMIGYRAEVKKADFTLSREVDSAEWVKFKDALERLREGSIAWQLVNAVINEQ